MPGTESPKVDSGSAAAARVGAGLRSYLSERLRVTSLGYSEHPVEMTDGWETYAYRFQPQGPDLPPAFGRPLTLRIYSGDGGLPRAQHEFAAQRHVHRLGYPVPEPLLLEECCDYFAGPFLVNAHAPGRTLVDALLQEPWRIWREPARMAELHAWLHRLPARDFPTRDGPLLARSFNEMAEIIDGHGLDRLARGLDWLCANRPKPPAVLSILHLDFHPINLIEDPDGRLTAIDWTEADVGDSHADLATTLMLMKCVPVEKLSGLDRLAMGVGRFWLRRRYLLVYRKQCETDEVKLGYYRAWAALRRLCRYERWLQDGPAVTGSKPHLLRHLSAVHLQSLRWYFERWTGVRLRA